MPRITFSPRVAFAAALAAIFVWVVLDALVGYGQRSSRAALFPLVIGVPALGLSVLAMVGELRQTRSGGTQPDGGPAVPLTAGGASEEVLRRRTIVILAWIVGFYLGIWLLGFMLTAPLATFLYIRVAGKKPGESPSEGAPSAGSSSTACFNASCPSRSSGAWAAPSRSSWRRRWGSTSTNSFWFPSSADQSRAHRLNIEAEDQRIPEAGTLQTFASVREHAQRCSAEHPMLGICRRSRSVPGMR